MSETKHTPGPWKVDSRGRIVTASTNDDIYHLCDDERYDANNNLIAAAPDMLATLEGVLIHLNRIQDENKSVNNPFDEDNADAIAYVEQAITKAKGGAK